MQSFVTAAEAVGLGCCPVSAMRNHARSVSDALGLPAQVFPVAGLAVGWPTEGARTISMRMPLSAVIHEDRFDDSNEERAIDAYDQARHERQRATKQRASDRFGEVERYTWSEDKARRICARERATFGQYGRTETALHLRRKGSSLSVSDYCPDEARLGTVGLVRSPIVSGQVIHLLTIADDHGCSNIGAFSQTSDLRLMPEKPNQRVQSLLRC